MENEEEDISEDPSHFDKWYELEELRFHCGHFDDRQIARSAFHEGGKFVLELLKSQTDIPGDVIELVNKHFWELV